MSTKPGANPARQPELWVPPTAPDRAPNNAPERRLHHRGHSAERHVWSDRWRRPLWMKRECIGMGSKPWAILHRHPLDPEVPQHSVAPGFWNAG